MTEAEFPRPIRLDTIGGEARAVSIEAEPAERAALAQRFGLIALDRLTASANITRQDETVLVSGRLAASVTQACVASGEPVPAMLDEPFALRFVPETAPDAEEVELAEDELDVLFYQGGVIDLGEAAAQTLALALDPFPRAPHAAEALREAGVIGEEDASPFAVLKSLKDRL